MHCFELFRKGWKFFLVFSIESVLPMIFFFKDCETPINLGSTAKPVSFLLSPANTFRSYTCLSMSVPNIPLYVHTNMHTRVLPCAHFCLHTPAIFICLCHILDKSLRFVIQITVICIIYSYSCY